MTLSFFVDHLYFYGARLPELVGTSRVARYMPLGSALEAGHRISIHTDNPATPIDPWRAIRTAVMRTPRGSEVAVGPKERLTVKEALYAVTRDAAWQLGLEDEVGTLEVGKRADLVLLNKNPLKMAPERLVEMETLGTFIAGQPTETRGVSRASLALAWRALISAMGLGD